ncbi:MAG: hypothetical protein ACYDEQ_00450 [Desulfocucumaceae bacterium]
MFREWVEKNLQEPFFQAEMHKAQINLTEDADKNLGTIKALAVYGATYVAFCIYCYAKYIN